MTPEIKRITTGDQLPNGMLLMAASASPELFRPRPSAKPPATIQMTLQSMSAKSLRVMTPVRAKMPIGTSATVLESMPVMSADLGLIIIDEEHESTYKSQQPPRYHARETGIQRARLSGASVVLGSATPSVGSYFHAMEGDYHLYRLKRRAGGGQLPKVHITDLRAELMAGNRSIIGRELQTAIKDRLDRGEQTMLFLNRRGMAGFVSCKALILFIKT